MVDKTVLEEKVLKHSEKGNFEKANKYLDDYTQRDDTSDKDIEELIKKALMKAQGREE